MFKKWLGSEFFLFFFPFFLVPFLFFFEFIFELGPGHSASKLQI